MKSDLHGILEKALSLHGAILADQGSRPLEALAADLALPRSTAYRLVSALAEQGLVIRSDKGRYFASPGLLDRVQEVDPVRMLAAVCRPEVRTLAKMCGQVVHLGILQGGMVTYVVKAGAGHAGMMTREGMQLEAYCSAIGKVLLAFLSDEERELYLGGGAFVRLTAQTIVEPTMLRQHLDHVRTQGFATDKCEMDEGLICIAVPVLDSGDVVRAAVSISTPCIHFDARFQDLAHHLLLSCADVLSRKMYPRHESIRVSRSLK